MEYVDSSGTLWRNSNFSTPEDLFAKLQSKLKECKVSKQVFFNTLIVAYLNGDIDVSIPKGAPKRIFNRGVTVSIDDIINADVLDSEGNKLNAHKYSDIP